MKTLRILLCVVSLAALGGCVTLTHTLGDGTAISFNGDTAKISNGKSVVEFELPKK